MTGQQSVAAPCRRPNQNSDISEEMPIHRFFKIILQRVIEDKKVKLPMRFVKRYEHELSDTAKLTVSKGKTWQVKLTKQGNIIWFDDGWHEFIKFYSICHGHLLVFKYKGVSSFNVNIFNMTACEIPYPHHNKIRSSDHEKDPKIPQDWDGNKNEIPSFSVISITTRKMKQKLDNFSPGSEFNEFRKRQDSFKSSNHANLEKEFQIKGKKCKIEEKETEIDQNESKDCEEELEIFVTGKFYNIFPKLSFESQRAVIAARKYKPKYPAFLHIIQSEISPSLYIPAKFSKKFLNNVFRRKIKIRLSDEKQWQCDWLVKISRRVKGGLVFTEGWSAFSRNNKLGFGDVCVFELIDSKNFVFRVLIFHAFLQ